MQSYQGIWSMDKDLYSVNCKQGEFKISENGDMSLYSPFGYIIDFAEKISPNQTLRKFGPPLEADFVYGLTNKNQFITLHNCICTRDIRIPGYSSQYIYPEDYIISDSQVQWNPEVSFIVIECPDLKYWIDDLPFDVELSYCDKSNEVDFVSQCSIMEKEYYKYPILFDDDHVQVIFEYNLCMSGIPPEDVTTSLSWSIKFNFKENIEFHTAMDEFVYPIVDFISFCMGTKLNIGHVSSGNDDYMFNYVAKWVKRNQIEESVRFNPIIYFSDVRDNKDGLVQEWLVKYNDNDDLLYSTRILIYLSSDRNMPIEVLFTSVASSLEAIARRRFGTIKRSEPELDSFIKKVKKSNLESEYKDEVIQIIKNSNFISQRQLYKKMINELEYIVPGFNKTKFIGKHLEMRNSFTHNRELKFANKNFSDICMHIDLVEVFAYCSILKELGLSEEKIQHLLSKNNELSKKINLAKSLYKK